ncbi:MAG: OmpH family outer membrane protein [Myxococcota bacterium]
MVFMLVCGSLLGALGLGLGEAWAGRIGVVDMALAIRNTGSGRAAEKRLRARKRSLEQRIARLKKHLGQKKRVFDRQRTQMTSAQRTRSRARLRLIYTQLQELFQSSSRKLQSFRAQEEQRIIQQMKPILERIRRKNRLDMIVDRRSTRVLAYDQKFDFTRRLVCLYVRKYGGERSACQRGKPWPTMRKEPKAD